MRNRNYLKKFTKGDQSHFCSSICLKMRKCQRQKVIFQNGEIINPFFSRGADFFLNEKHIYKFNSSKLLYQGYCLNYIEG